MIALFICFMYLTYLYHKKNEPSFKKTRKKSEVKSSENLEYLE